MDTTAINYILMNSTTIFQRSQTSRTNVSRLLGPGLLVSEAEQHKQQVRINDASISPPKINILCVRREGLWSVHVIIWKTLWLIFFLEPCLWPCTDTRTNRDISRQIYPSTPQRIHRRRHTDQHFSFVTSGSLRYLRLTSLQGSMF